MNRPPVITIIGAASITFGTKVLTDMVNHPQLDGATLRFVDINDRRLQTYTALAKLVEQRVDHSINIESSTDRRRMLPGSDFIMISVENSRYDRWEEDYRIPRELGSGQVYAELGGPGGMFHAFRQIPLHLEIGRDIAELCPQALVTVESNPLNRICLALERYTDVGTIVGLCHGVEITSNTFLPRVLEVPGEQIETTAAGTNHQVWILDMWNRATGEDLYPEFRRRMARRGDPAPADSGRGSLGPTGEPANNGGLAESSGTAQTGSPAARTLMDTWDPSGRERFCCTLFDLFGLYPAPGDTHVGEYYPFASEYVPADAGRFRRRKTTDEERWAYFERVVAGDVSLDSYGRDESHEAEELRLEDIIRPRSWVDTLGFPIFAAMTSNQRTRMPAVNMMNTGQIDNLPRGYFVETPAVVDGGGVRPIAVGDLPSPPVLYNRRDIDQTELVVEAAATGDRKLALQAMLADPTADSIPRAEKILDAMLKTQAEALPQFA